MTSASRKVEPKLTCVYCQGFQGAAVHPTKENSKMCAINKKEVQEETESCPQFNTVKYFWCRNGREWVDIRVCKIRQARRVKRCKGCVQGQQINLIPTEG